MKIDRLLRIIGEHLLVSSLRRAVGTGPREPDYQPMPWLGWDDAARAGGTLSRLSAIEAALASKDIRDGVVLDIGSHSGFFSLKLAEKGFFVYGAESIRQRVYLSFVAGQRIKGSFTPIWLKIERDNVARLPDSDITLCLSVWHHWVRNFGLEDATAILSALARKTRRVMFFDSGEGEMGERYRLPYGESEDAAGYLEDYLRGLPNVRSVSRLGAHQAFSPQDADGNRRSVLRTLFCVEMKNPSC
jgi:hypothetical protein